jgi:glycosyltransferase involved in cell wall biosynthesis
MKFSVVTPSFNQGEYIAETLASVREAAARAPEHMVEHIVMDAESTDGTLQILQLQDFAKWWSEPDAGQADAVNKGWAKTDADVLSFLCSDDLWEPDAIRRVAEAFVSNPHTDVVYGDYAFLEGNSGWRRRKTAGPFSAERLRRRNFLCQPATFIRSRVYQQFGGLDLTLRYCMDNEYWLRICESTNWRYIRHPLAVMRQHSAAKTSSQLTDAWWEAAKMARRHGLGRRYWWLALRTQCGGQLYYAAKRSLFNALGHFKNSRIGRHSRVFLSSGRRNATDPG